MNILNYNEHQTNNEFNDSLATSFIIPLRFTFKKTY